MGSGAKDCPNTSEEPSKVSYLPIVARGDRGDWVLHLVQVRSSDSGSTVMKKLRQRLADAKAFDSRFKRALRCQKPVVDIANVGLVSPAAGCQISRESFIDNPNSCTRYTLGASIPHILSMSKVAKAMSCTLVRFNSLKSWITC